MSDAVDLLTLRYDPDQPEGSEFSVAISELAIGALDTFTDFELAVFAAEAGIAVRRALEMPPSPPR